MHKTVYIDHQEEITTVVEKIKKEAAPDIFLVIPKGAIFAHGIINLKILKREAEKIGKNIFIITDDEKVKKFAKKIEITIKDKQDIQTSDDFELKDSQYVKTINEHLPMDQSQKSLAYSIDEIITEREIGSKNFFDVAANTNTQNRDQKVKQVAKKIRKIPFKVKREMERKNKAKVFLAKGSFLDSDIQQLYKQEIGRKKQDELVKTRKAQEFFLQHDDQESRIESKKFNFKFLYYFVGIALALAAAGFIFVNFPKLKVRINLNHKELSTRIDLTVKNKIDQVGSKEVKGEIFEFEIEEKMQFKATSEGYSNDSGKARGEVKILNKFSSASQPLVAGTRILSKEGKLFRLTKNVTVPGMTGQSAGEISVEVIADRPGADFNLEPTTFTIEGFKGGPKYEKFEVFSSQTMTDGKESDDNQKTKIVSTEDIDKARVETLDHLKNDLEKHIQEHIPSDMIFFADSAEKEITEAKSLVEAGTPTEKFDFLVKQKIKIFAIEKASFFELLEKQIQAENNGNYQIIGQPDYVFEKFSNNFREGIMTLTVKVIVQTISFFDEENVKLGLDGKKQQEIIDTLENYPEIEKVEIFYSPSFMSFVPVSKNNIKFEISQ